MDIEKGSYNNFKHGMLKEYRKYDNISRATLNYALCIIDYFEINKVKLDKLPKIDFYDITKYKDEYRKASISFTWKKDIMDEYYLDMSRNRNLFSTSTS